MASISSSVTRALVVSTRDPLFSGRVKVWIPTAHGHAYIEPVDEGPDTGETLVQPPSEADEIYGIVNLEQFIEEGNNGAGTAKNADHLPWAYVLGHNWGPIGNLKTGLPLALPGQPSGVMNIPQVGTEVFIIFEDDNPNQPIVIGSVFHKDELLAMSSVTGLELAPGIKIDKNPATLDAGNYTDEVSNSYVIRSKKGSSLIISDIPEKEQIILGGSISFTAQTDFVNVPKGEYSIFAENYPNFPTTASASFAVRTPITQRTNTLAITPKAVDQTKSTTSRVVVTGNPTNSSYTKVTPAKNKQYPVSAFNNPTGGMVFKAPRTNRPLGHLGIDLGCSVGTLLVAPVEGQVLAYSDSNPNGTAGNYLIFKGSDGYCQRFVHLKSIHTNIKVNVNKGTYPMLAAGTLLGETGNTGKDKQGNSYPPHLHWEVLSLYLGDKSFADQITTREIALDLFTAAQGANRRQVVGTSVSIDYHQFLDPIKDWIIADTGAKLTIVNDQAMNVMDSLTQPPEDTAFNKIIGLEVSLTPGKEHIFMRHSSGAYLGFDADGNFKLFTPGDAHARVNRSSVLDTFGAITVSGLSMFTRIKTVIRTAASKFDNLYNGGVFTPFTSDGKPNAEDANTYAKFPEALFNIDVTRNSDMKDALIQSTSNLYISVAEGTENKRLVDTVLDNSTVVLSDREMPDKHWNLTTYDDLIKKAFNAYIGNSKNKYIKALISPNNPIFTWKLFKAQMLQESNGEIKKGPNSAGAWGLFQLQGPAVQDVKGKKINPITKQEEGFNFDVNQMATYEDPAANIDMAVQYFAFILGKLIARMQMEDIAKDMTSLTAKEQDALVRIALLAYNKGYSYILKRLPSMLKNNGGFISYMAVEQRMRDDKTSRENMTYVPRIVNYILRNLPN